MNCTLPIYVNISKTKWPPRTTARQLIASALNSFGIRTYQPQLCHETYSSVAANYSGSQYVLPWHSSTYEHVAKEEEPLLFHASAYWFGRNSGSNAKAFSWIGRDGKKYSLENPDEDALAEMLGGVLTFLKERGIVKPWIMVDEPPHLPKYGWTEEIERRYVIFTNAAVRAGWTVGVCVPGPGQLAFWVPKLKAQRWLLSAKHPTSGYGTHLDEIRQNGREIWLYNMPVGANYEEIVRSYAPSGYLNWTFDEAPHALGSTKDGRNCQLTTHGEQLLRVLRSYWNNKVGDRPTLEQVRDALRHALELLSLYLDINANTLATP